MKASFLKGSGLFLAALCLMTYQPVFAQYAISGYAYELQSGQPLEGVRVHIKNRQGLEIGTMPAVYSNDKGYFEVPGVRSNDYRLEVTHTFETANGPVALRLFTNSDLIQIDTTNYSVMIGLSRLTVDRAQENMERDRAFTSSLEERNGKFVPALPDSSLQNFWHWNAENFLFGSRIVVEHRRDLRFMESGCTTDCTDSFKEVVLMACSTKAHLDDDRFRD